MDELSHRVIRDRMLCSFYILPVCAFVTVLLFSKTKILCFEIAGRTGGLEIKKEDTESLNVSLS